MSVEIANIIHAMATLNLANVADSLLLLNGFGIVGVTRASAGVYTVTLATPLDLGQGVAFIQHAGATSRIVVAQIQDLTIAGADNLQINAFTDAGVAADTGGAYLVVYRYPVIA